MASGGLRVGDCTYLKWDNIQPIYANSRLSLPNGHFGTSNIESGPIIAARVLIYSGTDDKYPTFSTPEAYEL